MKKIKYNKKAMPIGRQGFSLIELMVSIAIVSIMTVVSLVSLNAAREEKAVEIAAREVAATLRETQNEALTGKGLTAISPECEYIFSWEKGTANYGITGCKTQDYNLKNEVKFGGISGSESVTFSVPFSTATITAQDIVLKRGSSNYHVCIYPSGIISEKADAC